MTVPNIKSNIHKLVEQIQNEELLQVVHDFLKAGATTKTGELWKSLSADQREQLLVSIEDSESDDNLLLPSDLFQ